VVPSAHRRSEKTESATGERYGDLTVDIVASVGAAVTAGRLQTTTLSRPSADLAESRGHNAVLRSLM
jgi:hypothetical protein